MTSGVWSSELKLTAICFYSLQPTRGFPFSSFFATAMKQSWFNCVLFTGNRFAYSKEMLKVLIHYMESICYRFNLSFEEQPEESDGSDVESDEIGRPRYSSLKKVCLFLSLKLLFSFCNSLRSLEKIRVNIFTKKIRINISGGGSSQGRKQRGEDVVHPLVYLEYLYIGTSPCLEISFAQSAMGNVQNIELQRNVLAAKEMGNGHSLATGTLYDPADATPLQQMQGYKREH
ncbi:hypothetical protein RHMOL_Rhmol04G0334600 [Rhododendron molle]|uniref:Uncharacterized protein n=1 Tax=Rhododendron molle TaxID=49168 RepID=A0ACC0P6Y8_RHOML|nr:hypothetical protein RHMOL_Rhmol04G0334600 [Rhododendron molle]